MNYIFTTYLTKDVGFSQHDSALGCKPDDFELIKIYYESIMRYNLNCIIFHNELSDKFINKYSNNNVRFVKYVEIHRPSYNDERFYIYRWYLDKLKDAENLFMTDLFDVEFCGDPFTIINDKYDLYVGSENGNRRSRWFINKFKELNIKLLDDNEVIYNAGIIGGSRDNVIIFLDNMIKLLNKMPVDINANTPVYLNYLNRLYKGKVFTGFPLHNQFRSQKNNGALIKHK